MYYDCMGTNTFIDTFCRLQSKLHLVAGRILKDEIEAQDAVQDTFCNLWLSDQPATSDEARYRLFAVLKNVCLNKLRRNREVVGIEVIDRVIDDPCNVDAELLQKLILDMLPPMPREVFRLSVYEDKEYEEIANLLDMKIEAVRVNMCRARKIIKERIKKINL